MPKDTDQQSFVITGVDSGHQSILPVIQGVISDHVGLHQRFRASSYLLSVHPVLRSERIEAE